MPKATQGGASDVNVDPDYIAPAGVPPQDAIEQGLPDAGQPDGEPREADAAPDTGERRERDENAQNKDRSKATPAKKAATQTTAQTRSHIARNDK
jgi:hypothetical protein